ncbi:MAG: Fe-S-containing hydro-lyase [Clostridia bacterium]|nr:Fe-S-containing hydro-lyase [Clostridia bacterium]
MIHRLKMPLTDEQIRSIKIKDTVLLSGRLYTARDAAHKKLIALLDSKQELPFDIKGQGIYYTGPCPPKDGMPIGSCGPTTSGRMDAYTPRLLDIGLKVMIGKGTRSKDVIESMRKNSAVYLAATGGAGALIANCVINSRIIAFEELLSEAITEIEVVNMPLICTIDSDGNSLYK